MRDGYADACVRIIFHNARTIPTTQQAEEKKNSSRFSLTIETQWEIEIEMEITSDEFCLAWLVWANIELLEIERASQINNYRETGFWPLLALKFTHLQLTEQL